jgi:membrane protein YdbS with pleckstrin-like domain
MKQNAPRTSARKAAPKSPGRQFPWLTPRQIRALKIIFIISFVFSLVLELYVFGFPDGFFLHWLSALMVLFLFISFTVMGIIPLVNYVVNRWLRF